MKIALTQFYNEPREFLGLSTAFKGLVIDKIDTEVLSSNCFANIKAQYLEIWVYTYNGDFEVKQLSKMDRGKYFSFQFWFPYHTIMENENYIDAFLDYLFEGLNTVLLRYEVPKELLCKVNQSIKDELANYPEKYKYVRPAHLAMLDKILEEV